MSTSQISITADGSFASYAKGSYHIHHAGVTYLNYNSETLDPEFLPEDTTGEVVDGKLHVVGFGKKKHIFSPAKAVDIEVNQSTEVLGVVTYVAGSKEIQFKDEVYVRKGGGPICRIPQGIVARLEATTRVVMAFRVGLRGLGHFVFVKVPVDELPKKRKEMESKGEAAYMKGEKRLKVKYANAQRAVELANTALEAISGLMELEKAMGEEAGVKAGPYFDDADEPLEDVVSVIEKLKETAGGFC